MEARGDRRPQRRDASPRRREARDGLVVATHKRLHLTQPLEDRGRSKRSVVVIGSRERRRAQRHGLLIREQTLGPIGRAHEPVEGLGPLVAPVVVIREDVDELVEPVSEQRFIRIADLLVERPTHGLQLGLVRDVPDEHLPEAVRELRHAGASRHDPVDLEPTDALSDGRPGEHLDEHAVPERAPDDRCRPQDALRGVGKPVQTCLEHLLDRRGQPIRRTGVGPDAAVPLDEAPNSPQLPDDLLDEERVAAGAGENAVGEGGLRRELEDRLDQLARIRVVQLRELDVLRVPRRRPAGAACGREYAWQRRGLGHELGQNARARVIDPMQVLGSEEEWSAGSGLAQDAAEESDEDRALPLRVERRPRQVADDLQDH